jgi:inosine-uridine nucleoside N-ribohydrolase
MRNTHESPKKVIVDGDFGPDELFLKACLLTRDEVSIQGLTATFGNVDLPSVLENARRVCGFLEADEMRIFKGAATPSNLEQRLLSDGAFPFIEILPSPEGLSLQRQSAVDFILETLEKNPPGTVTMTASGPLTNIATALRQDREMMRKIGRLIIMGGCTVSVPGKDMMWRRGNITPHAEFNFQQAALDAKEVMSSGLPITLLPMNCTHQLTFTPSRHDHIKELFKGDERLLRALLGVKDIQNRKVPPHEADANDRGLFNQPAHLDMGKFGLDPVLHDVNCALFMLYPEMYERRRGRITVELHEGVLDNETVWGSRQGRTEFTPDSTSNLEVAIRIKEPDFLFGTIATSLRALLREAA